MLRAPEMKLNVLHRTTYRYADFVTQNLNEVRLKPSCSDGQSCEDFELTIKPAAKLTSFLDFYFNYFQSFEVLPPHKELIIESRATVRTAPRETVTSLAVPMSRLPDCLRLEQCYDFVQSSTLVALSPEVWRLALDATSSQTDVWQCAVAIMGFIHSGFQYEPNSTTVSTPMTEVLQQRRGVCQDFAHVMLGMCRALKIPARYVSGYIYNGRTEQLIGAQASHAWCEIYLPDAGWRALDPTNNQSADDRYIKVAVGRDYLDTAPVKGHYRGTARREMLVEVEVSEAPEMTPLTPSPVSM
jgi:transglutaminase-like putative cysteine protease